MSRPSEPGQDRSPAPQSRYLRAGMLYGIGLGPGDPDLITVKGRRILESTPVIFVPSRAGSESQALRIAQTWIDLSRQEVIHLPLPMTLDAALLRAAWREALSIILEVLESGRDGAFLLLGDPLLYGTFVYCLEELKIRRTGIRVEVVPGVTSFSAAAAAACWPLAVADERFAVIPAVHSVEELESILKNLDVVALLKPGRRWREVLLTLERLGWAGDAVYAEKLGFPEGRLIRDLSALRDGDAPPYFSLILARRPGPRG